MGGHGRRELGGRIGPQGAIGGGDGDAARRRRGVVGHRVLAVRGGRGDNGVVLPRRCVVVAGGKLVASVHVGQHWNACGCVRGLVAPPTPDLEVAQVCTLDVVVGVTDKGGNVVVEASKYAEGPNEKRLVFRISLMVSIPYPCT